MTPTPWTSPDENQENNEKNRKKSPEITQNEKIERSGRYCHDLLRKDRAFEELVKKFQKWEITRDALEKDFQQRAHTSLDLRRSLGIDESEIKKFLEDIKCFDNQMMYEIERANTIKAIAKEELIADCIEAVDYDYEGITDDQKEAIKKHLRENKIDSLKLFLESKRYRKKVTNKIFGDFALTESTELENIDFVKLHEKIVNLPLEHPDTRRIQDVWNTLLWGVKQGDNETFEQAFRRVQENGSEGDLTADYEAFFNCSDELISPTNKNTIRKFLIRSYKPTISFANLAEIDPEYAKQKIEEIKIKHPDQQKYAQIADSDINTSLEDYRQKRDYQEYYLSLLSTNIPVTSLDKKMQLRVLGRHVSEKRIEQKNDFYKGKIGESYIPGVDFEKAFYEMHGFPPDDVMTDMWLIEKLESQHPRKFTGSEHFAPGAIMRWKYTDNQGNPQIGYYQVRSTLGNNDDPEGDIKLVFLGNNNPKNGKLSPSGRPLTPKTGPQYYEYIDHCLLSGKDSEISFIPDDGQFGSEAWQKVMNDDGVSMYDSNDLKKELRARYANIAVPGQDDLNGLLDDMLYGKGNKLEDADPEKRKLREGMVFALCKDNELDTFQITEISDTKDTPGWLIELWDGLPEIKWDKRQHRMQLTFQEFIGKIKDLKTSYPKGVYRVPFGQQTSQGISSDQFNALMKSEGHAYEWRNKKLSKISIKDGKLYESDATGNQQERTVIKVEWEENADMYISHIGANTATVRYGTFHQTHKDKKDTWHGAEFHGSPDYEIPLSLLWSTLQTKSYALTKEDTEPKFKETKDTWGKSMSWLNILLHSHSLGVILHGDLWTAPFKAWEEQHHKDHAFNGKIAAALAIEKLQWSGWVVGSVFNWAEWPSLMVADANGSFQSYLDELVNKIDGMGSYHRTRLIKKWARSEHFPSAKFMAAMMASMAIFGQLYPYNNDKDDPRNKDHHGHPCHEWFWYNSIAHTNAVPLPVGWPSHMPPHHGYKWPSNSNWEPLTEIQACFELFWKFKHPILQNLGRRFQKYMNQGFDKLKDGGEGNLDQRTTMEDKLDWMMTTVISSKPTEAFGGATDKWLTEWYPTAISTMPYAALLFGSREQQLVPKLQDHLRQEFQKTAKVPMFVFAQNKNLGDVFRETGVAFAYTIDPKPGDKNPGEQLRDLIKRASPRLKWDETKKWQKDFMSFWSKYGREVMHKMTGMRDPTMDIMIRQPNLFEQNVASIPPGHPKKKQYEYLLEKRSTISAYYDRICEMQNDPNYAGIRWQWEFYAGNHFRVRKGFENGYPMFSTDWDSYIDANLDPQFTSGASSKSGDGIYNEMRGFFDAMPQMAKDMAKDMGLGDNQKVIDNICRSLYEGNIKWIKPIMNDKIKPETSAVYYNVSSMVLGFADIREFTQTAADPTQKTRFKAIKNKMIEMNKYIDSLVKDKWFAAGLAYRTKMYPIFEDIVRQEIDITNMSLVDIENRRFDDIDFVPGGKSGVSGVTHEMQEETENILQFSDYQKEKTKQREQRDGVTPFETLEQDLDHESMAA